MTFGPLVDAEWVHEHASDPDVRLIDFRWYLSKRDGRKEYGRGHVPGAVFVDLEAVTGANSEDNLGRHPLPTVEQFGREMRLAGIDDITRVVVYDDAGGSVAARLWFLLEWFGHASQAVLDGGLQAWRWGLESEPTHVQPGSFRARPPDRSKIVDFNGVERLEGVPLLDARAGERYRGETEPVDPKAGHVPGALSAPFSENLGPDMRFKSATELRKRYAALGAEEAAVVYCGSGVNACHNLLAMRVAGIHDVRLYAGAWSDWSNRDLPVVTGAEPG